jgi:uncharacterized membrane protein
MSRDKETADGGKSERALLLALVAAALFLRLWELGAESFWVDEILTAGRAEKPAWQLFQNLRRNNNLPAYFLLTQPLVKAAGTSEWTLRLPSALLGAGAALALWAAARRIWGGSGVLAAPFMAAAFAALSPFQVYYGQEARAYAMLALLTCVYLDALYALLFSRREGRGAAAALLAVVSVLGVHTHFLFSLFFLCGFLAAAAAFLLPPWRRHVRREALRPWLLASSLSLVLFLPWYFYAPRQLQTLPGMEHLGIPVLPPWELLRRVAMNFTAMPSPYPVAGMFETAWAALGILALGFGAMAFFRRRKGENTAPDGWKAGWLALWLALLLAAFYAAALTGQFSLFERYFIVFSAPLFLLASWGLSFINARRRAFLFAGWALVCAVYLALVYYPLPQKTPWREISMEASKYLEQGEILRAPDIMAISPLRHYGKDSFRAESVPAKECEKWRTPCFWQIQILRAQPELDFALDADVPGGFVETARIPVSDYVDLLRFEKTDGGRP